MNATSFRHVYGPVPSRRLGRSLGIDLVPYKTCTYDCVYCHLGPTTHKTLERKDYVGVARVLAELERKLADADIPDYISLAGSGEPTLNSGVGDLIDGIKGMTNIPVAVLTNGALLWMSEVQDALLEADLVLPSLDAGDERIFQWVNRPHRDISFQRMVDGLASFTRRFPGEVWLEVLLLADSTGTLPEAEKIAKLARRMGVSRVQLNTASRPTAEGFAIPVSRKQMRLLKGVFVGHVDIISDYKADSTHAGIPVPAGDTEVLALLSRRPCTANDVSDGLGVNLIEAVKHLDKLVKAGRVKAIRRGTRIFFGVDECLGVGGQVDDQ